MTTEQENNLIDRWNKNESIAPRVSAFNEGWHIAQEALSQQVRNILLARERSQNTNT